MYSQEKVDALWRAYRAGTIKYGDLNEQGKAAILYQSVSLGLTPREKLNDAGLKTYDSIASVLKPAAPAAPVKEGWLARLGKGTLAPTDYPAGYQQIAPQDLATPPLEGPALPSAPSVRPAVTAPVAPIAATPAGAPYDPESGVTEEQWRKMFPVEAATRQLGPLEQQFSRGVVGGLGVVGAPQVREEIKQLAAPKTLGEKVARGVGWLVGAIPLYAALAPVAAPVVKAAAPIAGALGKVIAPAAAAQIVGGAASLGTKAGLISLLDSAMREEPQTAERVVLNALVATGAGMLMGGAFGAAQAYVVPAVRQKALDIWWTHFRKGGVQPFEAGRAIAPDAVKMARGMAEANSLVVEGSPQYDALLQKGLTVKTIRPEQYADALRDIGGTFKVFTDGTWVLPKDSAIAPLVTAPAAPVAAPAPTPAPAPSPAGVPVPSVTPAAPTVTPPVPTPAVTPTPPPVAPVAAAPVAPSAAPTTAPTSALFDPSIFSDSPRDQALYRAGRDAEIAIRRGNATAILRGKTVPEFLDETVRWFKAAQLQRKNLWSDLFRDPSVGIELSDAVRAWRQAKGIEGATTYVASPVAAQPVAPTPVAAKEVAPAAPQAFAPGQIIKTGERTQIEVLSVTPDQAQVRVIHNEQGPVDGKPYTVRLDALQRLAQGGEVVAKAPAAAPAAPVVTPTAAPPTVTPEPVAQPAAVAEGVQRAAEPTPTADIGPRPKDANIWDLTKAEYLADQTKDFSIDDKVIFEGKPYTVAHLRGRNDTLKLKGADGKFVFAERELVQKTTSVSTPAEVEARYVRLVRDRLPGLERDVRDGKASPARARQIYADIGMEMPADLAPAPTTGPGVAAPTATQFAERAAEPVAPAEAGVAMPAAERELAAGAAEVTATREIPKPIAQGKTTTAKTEQGMSVDTRFALVEVDDLLASHDSVLRVEPQYPKELQPRERTRIASESQVSRIASTLDPERLGENPMASEGAPIVGPDLIVEAGNGRVIALKRVYGQKMEGGKQYRQWLSDNASRFGLDRSAVDNAKAPVLVRIRQTDVDRAEFARQANVSAVAAMSATEQAMADAKKLTGGIMSQFAPSETGDLLLSTNRPFIQEFFREVIGPAEQGRYMTKEGQISQEGLARVRNAVFAKAYGDTAAIEKLAESTDNNVRNITNAMLIAAPRLAYIKEEAAQGRLHSLDLTGDIADAMTKLSVLRESGESVEVYLKKIPLFGEELSPFARELLRVFDTHAASTKKVTSILLGYARAVEALGDPRQVSIIEGPKPTKAEVLTAAVRKVEKDYGVQTSLLEGTGTSRAAVARTVGETREARPTTPRAAAEAVGEGSPGTDAFFGAVKKLKPGQPLPGVLDAPSRKEITAFLAEKLGVPIRTGRLGVQARGIFKQKPEVIRTQTAHQLEVVAHEVGHFLDQKLGLGDKQFDAELLALGKRTSKPSYTKPRIRKEGVAEFMRLYLTEPAGAQKQAPTYYAEFEQRMLGNPDIHDTLLQARQDIHNYLNQPAKARVLSHISVGKKDRRPMTLNRLYQMLVDELKPLEVATRELAGGKDLPTTKDPFKLAWLARGWVGLAETYLHRGEVDENFNIFGLGLDQILEPVETKLDDFRAYAIARRANEVHKLGKETGLDSADTKQVVKDLDSPEFRKAFEDLVAYQDGLLKLLVREGVVSQEGANAMRKMHEDYIPLHRVFDESLTGGFRTGGKGFANLSSPVKRLKGSARPVVDPLESIVKNTFLYAQIAARNRVGKAFADLAEATQGSGQWAEKVPTPMHATKLKLEEVKDALIGAGMDEADVDLLDLNQAATIFRPSLFAPGKENILTIYRDGKPEYWQMAPELYRAMLFLDEESSNLLTRLMGYPAKILRAGAVLNPEFMTRNPLRDQLTALLFSKYGYIPGVDFAKGLFHAIKRDDLYWKYQASGAAQATLVSLDRDYLQGALRDLTERGMTEKVKGVVRHPIQTLQALSEFGEVATRLGEFAKGIQREGNTREGVLNASLAGRDMTVDFGRKGSGTAGVRSTNAFFNATIQGTDKMARAFRDNPMRTTLRCLLFITLPSVLLYLRNRNNPKYEELPSWQKDLFWIVDTGKFMLRIPKPFLPGVLFGTSVERILEWIDTEDPKALDGLAALFAESALPTLIPTALNPIVEWIANKNLYTNTPLVSQSEMRLEPAMQYGPHTSETAKLVGRILDVSPKLVDNTIRGYTGGLGRYGTELADWVLGSVGAVDIPVGPSPALADLPLIRAFVPRVLGTDSASIEEFYDKLDTAEKRQASLTKLGKAPSAADIEIIKPLKMLRQVSDKLSDYRKVLKQVYDSDMTAEQKRERLDEISLAMINLARIGLGKPILVVKDGELTEKK